MSKKQLTKSKYKQKLEEPRYYGRYHPIPFMFHSPDGVAHYCSFFIPLIGPPHKHIKALENFCGVNLNTVVDIIRGDKK